MIYDCCEHCEHDSGWEPDLHQGPCPEGCNDPQEAS